jgi:trans-aconitate methyltransferase
MKNKDLEAHWESVYTKKQVEKLGWFEENPVPSLKFIASCNLNKDSSILNVGAGATRLVDELLELGYTNIIANDLSGEALEKLKSRLGDPLSNQVKWIVDDLTKPRELLSQEPVNLWHDRAVLHFFTDHQEQASYFKLLKQLVKPGAFAIIAAFNLQGAPTCSGLPVFRYNQQMLQERLGPDFILQEAFDYNYIMPSGDERAYIYTQFKRVDN